MTSANNVEGDSSTSESLKLHRISASTGIKNSTLVPSLSSDQIDIRPPIASTRDLHMLNPSPLDDVESPLMSSSKIQNKLLSCCWDIPNPESHTSTFNIEHCWIRLTLVTTWPSDVYFSEFETSVMIIVINHR